MILPLLFEAALRSILLAICVFLVLRGFRVRDAQTQLIAWTMVLLASAAMPLLMQLSQFQPPAARITLPDLPDVALWTPAAMHASPTVVLAAGTTPTLAHQAAMLSWPEILLAVYIAGSVLFFLRLVLGFAVTWRLASLSQPVHDEWTAGHDVRVSDLVKTPMTFCTTIVLPEAYPSWPTPKRRAVMAHEGAHVRHGDFYVHALSAGYRVLFWFSPLAWWLQAELSELAERVSDDAAIANLGDAPSYAEILLDISQGAQNIPMAVAMARPRLISRRVERVIDDGYTVPDLRRRRKLLPLLALSPLLVVAAGTGLKASVPPAALALQSAQIAAAIKPVPPSPPAEAQPPHAQTVQAQTIIQPMPVVRPKAKPEQQVAQVATIPIPLQPAAAPAAPVGASSLPQTTCVLPPSETVEPPLTPSTNAGITEARNNRFAAAAANFRPLAEAGNHQAEYLYGKLLMQDCTGLQDKQAAVMWYTRAADAGVIDAQNMLAQAYVRGNGVAQDDNKAFALFTKAANAGNMPAQVDLGIMYLTGRATPKDLYQGMRWEMRAAEQGASAALMNIAEGYSRGAGLPKDNEKAAYFMNLALQRATPDQKNKFTETIGNMSRVLSADALADIAARSQHWAPGPGSMADVLSDAEKVHVASRGN